ncbi:enoyl-CoA hydratase/isomerase family protein [Hydrocarboniclastica marina]|uniref:3-hydroxyisobutyryl-CoA hydrolase n=1 Tax=Hydrocarboniclastica marina TaxID=2259620 RepID=A0A4P7XMA4_9ALTE|nr:enoyl-CoA hydratase/isomerase family protein [Hydrocarboniclastica marina]QCF27177.1 enoyl-CoA hydratase/isomerase family protein [Hydrocarboniclastica marina]
MSEAVSIEVANHVGHLTLNRPEALNTLTLDMVQALHRQLRAWAEDDQIVAIVIRAAGEKAFCAGGDIRALYDSYMSGDDLHSRFFDEEYALDQYLHNYPKPVVALLHGIVLGGGMGIGQGADFRLVTERTRMGMPEVGIGFFPDVGASYFLPRLPGKLGIYLGITGNHIKAADALFCGLADAYLSSDRIPELDSRLAALRWGSDIAGDLAGVIDALTCRSLPDAPLEALKPAIDAHFAHASVSAIRQALLDEDRPDYHEWAQQTVEVIDSRSPIAVAVTLENLRRGRALSLGECFAQESHLVHQWMDGGDFIEGVRALLVDKDNAPHWYPPTLAAVTAEQVQRFFAPA